mmetsp:Transcript_10174/g.30178  ORF Transcript_10174/g.30178 Transcript_10174/m.30178 type:complete len:234 (+) Transcript_10174:761-1462(+)
MQEESRDRGPSLHPRQPAHRAVHLRLHRLAEVRERGRREPAGHRDEPRADETVQVPHRHARAGTEGRAREAREFHHARDRLRPLRGAQPDVQLHGAEQEPLHVGCDPPARRQRSGRRDRGRINGGQWQSLLNGLRAHPDQRGQGGPRQPEDPREEPPAPCPDGALDGWLQGGRHKQPPLCRQELQDGEVRSSGHHDGEQQRRAANPRAAVPEVLQTLLPQGVRVAVPRGRRGG